MHYVRSGKRAVTQTLLEEREDDYAVSGDITFQSVSPLYEQLMKSITGRRGTTLAIDFSGIVRIDSSAVALLVGVWIFARKSGKTIVFSGLNSEFHSLVTLYGVDWIVDREPLHAINPDGRA